MGGHWDFETSGHLLAVQGAERLGQGQGSSKLYLR